MPTFTSNSLLGPTPAYVCLIAAHLTSMVHIAPRWFLRPNSVLGCYCRSQNSISGKCPSAALPLDQALVPVVTGTSTTKQRVSHALCKHAQAGFHCKWPCVPCHDDTGKKGVVGSRLQAMTHCMGDRDEGLS